MMISKINNFDYFMTMRNAPCYCPKETLCFPYCYGKWMLSQVIFNKHYFENFGSFSFKHQEIISVTTSLWASLSVIAFVLPIPVIKVEHITSISILPSTHCIPIYVKFRYSSWISFWMKKLPHFGWKSPLIIRPYLTWRFWLHLIGIDLYLLGTETWVNNSGS